MAESEIDVSEIVKKLGDPSISDAEFNRLMGRLIALKARQ